MTTIRKLLLSLLCLMLPVSAALAADKQYILTVAAATSATPQPAYKFTFTNDGNSSFNALSLSLPSGWSVSTAGGVSTSRGSATFTSTARNVIYVQNINLPNGAGQSMTVTVTGVTAGASTCGSSQTGTWTAQPWTGSSVGSGQTFSLKPGTNFPSTTVPPSCYTITASAGTGGTITPSGAVSVATGTDQAFTITANPTYRISGVLVDNASVGAVGSYTFPAVSANHTIVASFLQNTLSITTPSTPVVAGSAFAVSVGYDGPNPATVSLETSCTTSTVATQSVNNPTASPVAFSVTVPKAGSCTLTAKATNYADKTISTPLTVYTGTLACAGTASSSADVDVTQDWSYPRGSVLTSGGYSLVRGENKSGPTCTSAVPYTFTLDTTGTQSASFIVPSTEVQKVAAQYVVVWAPVKTTGGWYEARTQLAWVSNGSGPIYMPALPCTQDPTNFAALTQTELDSLMPAIPNAYPYNVDPLASAYGFSTPGNIVKAKMCVSQHGWTSVGPVQSEDENGTKTLVQPWDKIIDLGDGFASRDF
ncbi:MAG: hypothetical protein U1F54_05945 [Burkholderiales bacterium]